MITTVINLKHLQQKGKGQPELFWILPIPQSETSNWAESWPKRKGDPERNEQRYQEGGNHENPSTPLKTYLLYLTGQKVY